MAKKWLIFAALMATAVRSASADPIANDITAIDHAGMQMNRDVYGCVAEMKLHQDVEHNDCKAFIRAADTFSAARTRVLEYAFAKGLVDRDSSPLEHMAAIAKIAKDARLPTPIGVIAGWQAMDQYLDQLQALNQ